MTRGQGMKLYDFPEGQRRFVEGMRQPFVVCQILPEGVVTLAVSDGFCASFNLDREAMFAALRSGMRAHTHPDDVAWVHNANAAFLRALANATKEIKTKL